MESERNVTKLLEEREVLRNKALKFASNPNYDLGEFLQNIKPEPNPYDSRFVFIK